jgi:hypothetical protein
VKSPIVWFVLAALSAVAHAQPAGAQAEVLFRQGRELMAKGKYVEACAAFDASQKLEPSPSTVLNQAECRERRGQIATAWGLYLQVARSTRATGDEPSKQMHRTAADNAKRLESELSTLAIEVSDDANIGGLEVLRDGEIVDVGAWNKLLPIDGGTYRVTAHAPGNAEWTTTVTVATTRDAKSVQIPKLKARELPKPPVAAATPPPARSGDAAADAPPARPRRRASWLPYAIGGGALALGGGALALELSGESTYAKAKAELDPAKQTSLWRSANDARYAAEALAIGGVAAAGVAVWLYVRGRRGERSIAVAPTVSGGSVGIHVTGGF